MHPPSPSIDELITYATLWQGGDGVPCTIWSCHTMTRLILHAIFQKSFPNNQHKYLQCNFNLSLHQSYPRDHQEIFSTSRQLPSRLILKDDEWGQIDMSTLNVQGLHTLVKQATLLEWWHPYVIAWQDAPVFFIPDCISASYTCIMSYRPLLRWQMEPGNLPMQYRIAL